VSAVFETSVFADITCIPRGRPNALSFITHEIHVLAVGRVSWLSAAEVSGRNGVTAGGDDCSILTEGTASRLLCRRITGTISVIGWVVFALVAGSLVQPQQNQLRIRLSECGLRSGVLMSAVLIIAGFFRHERREKVHTIIFGSIMLLRWIFAAVGSLPVS
jgi:hypothetical protein